LFKKVQLYELEVQFVGFCDVVGVSWNRGLSLGVGAIRWFC